MDDSKRLKIRITVALLFLVAIGFYVAFFVVMANR